MEDANIFDGTSSRLLRHELPYLFHSSCSSAASSSSSQEQQQQMYSKLNVSREEANELIRRHNEVYHIADDVQEVFKK